MLRPDSFYAALDREPGIVLVLDAVGIIRFLNRAWSVSLKRDHAPKSCDPGEVLGRPYLDFVAGDLKVKMKQAFERAFALDPTDSVWVHGECNTAKLYRKLSTRITALEDPATRLRDGFLVHSDLRIAGPLSDRYEPVELDVDAWRDTNGLIVQCGCCRRVREPGTGRWAMGLELIERPVDGTSHGLCDLCLETFYGEPEVSSAAP